MKIVKYIALVVALVLFAGCSSTSITSTWKASGFTARKYNKVMVVGIIRDADKMVKQKMEGHLVDDLRALGYNAVSAFDVYGPRAFQDMEEEKITAKLAKEDIDAVITVVLLDKEKERYYTPGRVIYSPYVTYHYRFPGYYRSIYYRIDEPGYYNVSTRYFWESNFYDLRENKLIYSVQTESFDPSSTESLAHQYGQKIIQVMIKDKVLEKQENIVAKAL